MSNVTDLQTATKLMREVFQWDDALCLTPAGRATIGLVAAAIAEARAEAEAEVARLREALVRAMARMPEGEHLWQAAPSPTRGEFCWRCGNMRRADDKNKPCSGKLPRIEMRAALGDSREGHDGR